VLNVHLRSVSLLNGASQPKLIYEVNSSLQDSERRNKTNVQPVPESNQGRPSHNQSVYWLKYSSCILYAPGDKYFLYYSLCLSSKPSPSTAESICLKIDTAPRKAAKVGLRDSGPILQVPRLYSMMKLHQDKKLRIIRYRDSRMDQGEKSLKKLYFQQNEKRTRNFTYKRVMRVIMYVIKHLQIAESGSHISQ
jgi:hypothetical protein